MLRSFVYATRNVESQNMSQLLTAEGLQQLLGAWVARPGRLHARLSEAIGDAIARSALEDGARLPRSEERRVGKECRL